MQSPRLCLLDTNILVAVVRGGKLGQHIENEYHLISAPFRPLISVVSIGELLKLTREFNWGQAKTGKLWELLGNLVKVEIGHPSILEAYAEIGYFCRKSGNSKPHNDCWIGATAKATGAVLLTTDTDFDIFHGRFIERILIDESLAGP